MLRSILLGATALLLVGCGGEKYPVPAAQAASLLAGLSYSPAIAPMPVALRDVTVNFESLPGGNAVQWSFSKDGDDLGKIVATIEKSGEAASEVTVDYVDGTAPDTKGDIAKVRAQLRGGVQQLLIEAVDSTLDGRQFNMALRDQVDTNITVAMMGSMMVAASDAMDKAEKKGRTGPRRTHGPKPVMIDPYNKAAPTTDLSQYN